MTDPMNRRAVVLFFLIFIGTVAFIAYGFYHSFSQVLAKLPF
jgi:hypothetical protein